MKKLQLSLLFCCCCFCWAENDSEWEVIQGEKWNNFNDWLMRTILEPLNERKQKKIKEKLCKEMYEEWKSKVEY